MSNTRVAVLVALALVVVAAVWTNMSSKGPVAPQPGPTTATAPPPASTAAPSPALSPSTDATPAPPAPTASPVAPAAPAGETSAPPAAAQTPATPPATPATPPAAEAPAAAPAAPNVQTADPFGEEQTLTAKKVVILKGSANWDSAFETLVASLKTLSDFVAKQGIKPAGPSLIVYTSTDDAGFTYQAEIPVDQEPKNLAKGMSIGTSPEGATLKFVHRGSYDNMDNTYEAITNHLDDKKLEAKDTFIEEYITDPLTTTEDKLVINVFVPLK
ncbi:GyrI-like domain-containing protein [Bradyrhizobium sp. G127]|uniref:GyrI-like domain-containing protein n=1 Tax=Bradyrhizobium sp. G127 TaxID=2904800 RepID=UPI001F4124A3|nr:GyrI-like domain-containing protein [Bradyrhizobium sp. G127]MCF2521439.1 GyrI-like domain-containing protein [Bradyrhizobium sp. G127]